MKNLFSRLIAVLLGGIFSAGNNLASAQEFRAIGTGHLAEISGPIEADGGERFLRFLNSQHRVKGLRLNSPGGVVVGALSIAEEISKRKLSTHITKEHTCASACALLFFAGQDRLAEGRLGVHQMDDGGRADASTLQFVLADQLDAFQRFDVPWKITKYMLTTPPGEMHWISASDLEKYALNRVLSGDASNRSAPENNSGLDQKRRNFSEFPSKGFLASTPQFPDFSGRDKRYRMYRTRIRDGVAQGANFAGYFSVVEIGCGSACKFAFVVDLRTGEVGSFPYGGEEYYEIRLLYSPDSRMLRVRWTMLEDRKICKERDILMEGLEWKVLAERTTPLNNGQCGL